ncbi:hypothetical protein J7W19_06440 [Streptomyces mobaraensis NBRC 13819 = DSM 40847]|uniref:DUF4352 domain-containing protein n=1 Tax=Streptomyces mobaraensis (strain ATCC 29032 / DSM 40847 / JCM 4168 / NBRC 13819 / NCIMB 11159 / IPCR 16-22) TaxID=1223523 RepID=M3C1X9_STRM1|nr:hypothetical protein [Streptomyces mobaraensis]EME98015.1 hypothetical protein H340_23488 [Streptomyces mobaraensis NBRC 13819 = DSM 40847]QTT73111.1 hypothetical protein J7W19_06440 [Streptomyces mobaraensis NBRC 13819 = DSM 40847]
MDASAKEPITEPPTDGPAAFDQTAEPPAAETPAGKADRLAATWRWLAALAAVALICWGFTAVIGFFEGLGGGPVRPAADYRTQDIRTRAAGKAVIGRLRPGAGGPDRMHAEGSTSCVDDLGFDGDGVTRDQPHYIWNLEYAREADYLADLDKVRAAWREHGWKVRDTPEESASPDAGRRKPARRPGITTVADHGITLFMGPDWFTGKPILSADGGCVRYRADQGVAARESSGAARDGSPAREGVITYDDGVRVSIGPVRPTTLSPNERGPDAPSAHAYRVTVTVTNDSGAPVELSSSDIGSYANANPGVKLLGYEPPQVVSEGRSTRLELVYAAAERPSHLDIVYGPGKFHRHYSWNLSVP